MTVAIETAAETRTAAKKVAKKTKPAAKKKPEKVRGIGRVGDRFEVMLYLGSFATVEEAVAVREKGLAFKETLKPAPVPAPKKKVKAN